MFEKLFPQFALRRERTKLNLSFVKQQRQALESLPSFAQDNDENTWLSLTADKRILNEQQVQDMQVQALKMGYTPQGRNALDTMESYVIGKEAKITAIGLDDEGKLENIQKYWKGFVKKEKWDKKSKELLRRTMRDGESFLRFFEPSVDNEVKNERFTKIRFVEPLEIKDRTGKFTYGIETEQQDIETVINYHRDFQQKKSTSDISHVQEIEVIPADEMIHTKILVDSNVKRGISFLIGVAEYMTKYRDWLNDRIILNKIRNIFNLVGEVEGAGDMSSIKDSFADTTGKTPTSGIPKKKMPKRGSVLMTRGIKWEYKALNIKAQDTKDDGRNIQLMVGLGLQFPEYIVRGDASNANFASSMVAESPFVRMVEKYQDIFQCVYEEIFIKVITFGVRSGQIENITNADLELLEAQVDFDTLIHRDIEKETKSFVMHKDALGVVSKKTVSGKLGYDFEDEQKQLKLESDEEEERELKRELLANQNQPGQQNRNQNDNRNQNQE